MSMLSKIPSKYLKGHHIEAGEIVTIKEVCDEKVGVSKEEMSVIYFDEYDRGVILNKTNILALVKDLGDDEDTWPGRRIVLTTVPARNPSTGEDIDAIRMQAAPAKKKAAAKMATAVADEAPNLAESEDPGNWGTTKKLLKLKQSRAPPARGGPATF